MIHAGLPPSWTADDAEALGEELSDVVSGNKAGRYYKRMYGNEPIHWDPGLKGADRLRYITNALTRIRYLMPDGALTLRAKGPPGTEAPELIPWYAFEGRRSVRDKLVFGHWASLQFNASLDPAHNVFHVDIGCVWGRRLTAMRLDDERYFTVPAAEPEPARD